ncbi:hypothetical protein V6N13_042847 [Hibiscus sabdariffa]
MVTSFKFVFLNLKVSYVVLVVLVHVLRNLQSRQIHRVIRLCVRISKTSMSSRWYRLMGLGMGVCPIKGLLKWHTLKMLQGLRHIVRSGQL